MQLIGMLDSPFVRRTAISLQLMGIPFEHRAISVFRTFPQFAALNPVVKAPSLICDDGLVLMDSQLILDYAESSPDRRRSLMPAPGTDPRPALRAIGLALAAADKAVQLLYERVVRPAEKVHAPWVERQTGQMLAAFDGLEAEMRQRPFPVARETMAQAGVTAAVVWHFTRRILPEIVDAARFPLIERHSTEAERLPEFVAAPHGEDTYPVG